MLFKSSYRPTLSGSKEMPWPIIFDPGLGPAFNEPTWLNAIPTVDLVLPIQSFLKSLSRTRLLPKWPNLSSVELSAPMKQLSWSKASLLSRLFELHFGPKLSQMTKICDTYNWMFEEAEKQLEVISKNIQAINLTRKSEQTLAGERIHYLQHK